MIDEERERRIGQRSSQMREAVEHSPHLVSPLLRDAWYDINYLLARLAEYRDADRDKHNAGLGARGE